MKAWNNSNIAFVVHTEGEIIGYIRGGTVYCENLISNQDENKPFFTMLEYRVNQQENALKYDKIKR